MPTNISTINIKAPIQKVWDAITKPELVKQWQYGSDLITDWKVGSDIRFSTEWEGKIFAQWGKVLEIKPNDFIKYSLFAPRPDLEDKTENYFVMSYVLTDENSHIKLEIIQEDNRIGAVQEAPQGEENSLLVSLKNLAEST
jgi:Activator of Hsp90 ATPase homolog 1-like protein